MASIQYIKGVRTRFRNILDLEIQKGDGLLNTEIDEEFDLDRMLNEVSKCFEKVKEYKEKVERQSEKLVESIDKKESEMIEEIIDEDLTLCEKAFDMCQNLQVFTKTLMQSKEKLEFKVDQKDYTHDLVEVQKNIQQLLEAQMRQQEKEKRKENEKMSSIKLPKIDMISFNGDKTRWTEFWDSFKNAVHNNKYISNVEKFNYLKGKLVGEAKSAITGLALTSDNYIMAVDILRKRFGNTQEIIDLHYSQLINIPIATSKVNSLRCLLDGVDQHIRSLEVLEENVNPGHSSIYSQIKVA
ncbi:uncharacterized protein LOC132755001 [Ruditapes philippinarum]|uniref:uncharacterized protein LOC132755001 n=1 Tax=Ruditapes philippinarum TaxID=129788 RepID=UPI00295A70CB|nr:uncharacterized protein LOC132755001 [Ruditapes philippinarum]